MTIQSQMSFRNQIRKAIIASVIAVSIFCGMEPSWAQVSTNTAPQTVFAPAVVRPHVVVPVNPPPYTNSGDNTTNFVVAYDLSSLVSDGTVLNNSGSGGWTYLPVAVHGNFQIDLEFYGQTFDVDAHILLVDDTTNAGLDMRASPQTTDTPTINIFSGTNLATHEQFYFPGTPLATAATTSFPLNTYTHMTVTKQGNTLTYTVGGQSISTTVDDTILPPTARVGLGFYTTTGGHAGVIHFRNISITGDSGPLSLTTAKSTYQRDEIFDLTLKTPSQSTAQTFYLSMAQGTPTQNLGTRGKVLMWDVGNGENSYTQGPTGTQLIAPYGIVVPPNTDHVGLKVVVNLEQSGVVFKVTDSRTPTESSPQAQTQALTFTNRIRQYAEQESANNANVNAYDDLFTDVGSAWTDWGYGDGNGDYRFIAPATRFSPDLLKAMGFVESSMSATLAAKHSVAADIMQVNVHDKALAELNGGKKVVYDWNDAATPTNVTDKKGKVYPNVYLYDQTGREPVPNNTAVVALHYANHSPGAASVTTQEDSVFWAVRELLAVQTKWTRQKLTPVGQAAAYYASNPILLDVNGTLQAYGGKPFAASVTSCTDTGSPKKKEFIWPILSNMKARH